MADKRQREKLLAWLHDALPEWFENRVLPVDAVVCERWADLSVRAGTPVPVIDSFLAASAVHAGRAVATGNVPDFSRMARNSAFLLPVCLACRRERCPVIWRVPALKHFLEHSVRITLATR